VDYARAYDLVKRRVESDPVNLIEKVSADIARTLLHEFPTVEDVRVGVRKPHVAVSGVVDSLGVEIYRKRGEQF
jgi:dihydroneopterin aldolase